MWNTLTFEQVKGCSSKGGMAWLRQAQEAPSFQTAFPVGRWAPIERLKNKADGDYAKRLADPLGLEPDRTTFIFVTPRRWRNKAAWAMAKRREGRWKDVRAYDADDMATWLEQMPAVHIWFSKLVGKHPAGCRICRGIGPHGQVRRSHG